MSFEGLKKIAGQAEQIEMLKPREIKTAQGSVYRYLPDGRTQRFKTAESKMCEPQDALVFIPPWDRVKFKTTELYPHIFRGIDNATQYSQILLEYAQREGKTVRIIDENGGDLDDNMKIASSHRAFLAFVDKKDAKNNFTLPISKDPKLGYMTFDTRKYADKNGKIWRERHIGNEVTDILYEK